MSVEIDLDVLAKAVCMKCGREGDLDRIAGEVERLLEHGESAMVSAQETCPCGCRNWRLTFGAEPTA